MITMLFVLAIFVAIWFGFVLIARLIRGQAISAITFVVFAAAATALITKAIGMW